MTQAWDSHMYDFKTNAILVVRAWRIIILVLRTSYNSSLVHLLCDINAPNSEGGWDESWFTVAQ